MRLIIDVDEKFKPALDAVVAALDACVVQPEQPDQTLKTVFVLFHETNTGDSDESDGYVENVFATEELAQAALLARVREAVAEGKSVYWNPDDEEENDDWQHDWRVESWPVKTDLILSQDGIQSHALWGICGRPPRTRREQEDDRQVTFSKEATSNVLRQPEAQTGKEANK